MLPNCIFCHCELISTRECYHCENCPYQLRYFTFSERDGIFVFDFQIDVDSKRYVVVCWKVPGKNMYNITKPGTGLFRHSKMLVYKEGKIISSPQDALEFCNRVLNLKAFL